MKKILLFIIFLNITSYIQCQSEKITGKPIKENKIELAEFDFPNEMDWYEAKKACADLGDGWRLPTIFELSLLFEQRSRIGGFDSGDLGSCNYWSSTENGGVFAYYYGVSSKVSISDSIRIQLLYSSKNYVSYVRAVRSIK